MRTAIVLVGLALGLIAPLPLAAQDGPEDMQFDLRRGANRHPGETQRFRELGIGEWGISWAGFYTARSYNITDTRGLDNSLASSWLYSFDPLGVGFRTHFEYRASTDWRLSITPRADVAAGLLNTSRHATFGFEDLPFTQNYSAGLQAQKLSLNFELELAARWRWLWFTAKGNSWMAFRRTRIKGNPAEYRDPQLGTLDRVLDRDRIERDQAYVYGLSTGPGFEFFFLDESARFIVFTLYRPLNIVQFRDAYGLTHGFEFMVRSADFELTHQVGIFFEVGVQAYLPTDEFNDIYYTQFSLGVRWR